MPTSHRPKWLGGWKRATRDCSRPTEERPTPSPPPAKNAGSLAPPKAGPTPLPNPRAGLMTNTGRDARTRRPVLARRCVHGARGSPGRHRRDQRSPLLRTLCSRHLGNSAPASRLRPRPSTQRGSRPRSCLFKWWGQRAAPAAAAWVAPRAAIEGRTKMAAALAP